MSLPAWVRKHLENSSGLDYTTARGRKARPAFCRTCKARILTGLDGDPGIEVRADPTPLTESMELACVLTDRPTFLLDHYGGRLDLHRRHYWQLSQRSKYDTVLPEHRCGHRFPDPPPPTYLSDPNPDPPF